MPEMPESAFTELAQYRAIASTPAEVTRKIADLEKDNQKQRGEIDGLKEKAKGLPPEGAVVLTADEAKAHEAFKALGKTPEELGKLTSEVEELKTKDAARTRRDEFGKVKAAMSWVDDAVDTMANLKTLDGASFEFRTVKVKDKSGKDVDAEEPWITLSGDGQKPQKFAEYAANAPELRGIRATEGQPQDHSRIVPEQRGNPGKIDKSATALERARAENERRAKAPNALRPAAATT